MDKNHDLHTEFDGETDEECFILLYTGDKGFSRLNIAASFILRGETFIAGYEDRLTQNLEAPDSPKIEAKVLLKDEGEDSSLSEELRELCFLHVYQSEDALILENVSDECYETVREFFMKTFICKDGQSLDRKAINEHKAPLAEVLVEYSHSYFAGADDLVCECLSQEGEAEASKKVKENEEQAAVYSVYDRKGLRQTVVADFYADFSFPDESEEKQKFFIDSLDPELVNMLSKIDDSEEVKSLCEGIKADFSHTGRDMAELERMAERE